jgi:hypothetical protein
MAEIDGSIPAGVKVPNMLQSMGEMAQTMGAMNANRLFMAKQAAGQAVQASIGPDGQLDPARLNRLISQNPRIAPFASEALSASLAQQGAGIANTGAGLSLQAAQGDRVRALLGPMTSNPDITHDDIVGAIGLLANQGAIRPDFAAKIAGNLPADPKMAGAWMRNNFQLPALGPQGALTATSPAPVAVNTGDKIDLTKLPEIGAPEVVGTLDMKMTPEAKASPRTIIGPNNQPQQVPTSALVTDTGQPKVSPLTGPHGEVTTGLAPGVSEAASTAGQGSAAILNADRADQANSAQRITVLKHVNDLLASPEGKTGPGVQAVNGWRNFLLANAPALAALTNGGVNEAKIRSATQDELKKYMTQVAGAAAAQYGQGTNEKLAVAASGNANPELSNLANRDVTRMNIALERAKQARLAAWDASGQPPQQYGQFVSAWNRTHDPRAFMLDLLSPAERAKMLGGITSDADKRALLTAKRAAEQAGLFSEADIPR